MNHHPLRPSLECAVPLHVLSIKRMGYLPEIPEGMADLIASRGDVLMFGEKKGDAASIFNKLALTIAILSFAPGGIRVFGNHWESKL